MTSKEIIQFEFQKIFELLDIQIQYYENEHNTIGQWGWKQDIILAKCFDFQNKEFIIDDNIVVCFNNLINILPNYFKYLVK